MLHACSPSLAFMPPGPNMIPVQAPWTHKLNGKSSVPIGLPAAPTGCPCCCSSCCRSESNTLQQSGGTSLATLAQMQALQGLQLTTATCFPASPTARLPDPPTPTVAEPAPRRRQQAGRSKLALQAPGSFRPCCMCEGHRSKQNERQRARRCHATSRDSRRAQMGRLCQEKDGSCRSSAAARGSAREGLQQSGLHLRQQHAHLEVPSAWPASSWQRRGRGDWAASPGCGAKRSAAADPAPLKS